MTFIKCAKENNKEIAIHIERNRVPLFIHLMYGTSKENILWLYQIKRKVDYCNRSFHYIRARFRKFLNLKHKNLEFGRRIGEMLQYRS